MTNNVILQNMIEGKSLEETEKELLLIGIKAFSEYMVAIDPEYKYNKSFLSGFAEDFVRSVAQLQYKKKIFEESIVKPFEDYADDILIIMDGAWTFEKGKYVLLNKINVSLVNSDKIQYQIKHLKNPKFTIAKKTNIDNIEKVIQDDVERFMRRIERKDNEEI